MKTPFKFFQKGSRLSFLLTVVLILSCIFSIAQESAPDLYARVSLFKTIPGKDAEYLKYVRETMKPAFVRSRANGKIVQWIFFKVHFTGSADEYNYVGVTYSLGWPNTQQFSPPAILREINPKVDPAAIEAKLREFRALVREYLVYRAEAIEPNPPVPSKYLRIDYMKVKPGKAADYLRAERDDWMPFHQILVNQGQATGWALWQVVFPGGTDAPFDYIASNRYGTYDQVMAVDYEQTFRKASPAKNISDIFNRTTSSRDLVKSELWEVVDMLD